MCAQVSKTPKESPTSSDEVEQCLALSRNTPESFPAKLHNELKLLAEARGELLGESTLNSKGLAEIDEKISEFKSRHEAELKKNPQLLSHLEELLQAYEDRSRADAVAKQVWNLSKEIREHQGLFQQGDAKGSEARLQKYLQSQNDLLSRHTQLEKELRAHGETAKVWVEERMKTARWAAGQMRYSMEGLGTDEKTFDAALKNLTRYELRYVKEAFQKSTGASLESWIREDFADFGFGDVTSRISAINGIGKEEGRAVAQGLAKEVLQSIAHPEKLAELSKLICSNDQSKQNLSQLLSAEKQSDGFSAVVRVFQGKSETERKALLREYSQATNQNLLAAFESKLSLDEHALLRSVVKTGQCDGKLALTVAEGRAKKSGEQLGALLAQEISPNDGLLQEQFRRSVVVLVGNDQHILAKLEKIRNEASVVSRGEEILRNVAKLSGDISRFNNLPTGLFDKKQLSVLESRLDDYLLQQADYLKSYSRFGVLLEQTKKEAALKSALTQRNVNEATKHLHDAMAAWSEDIEKVAGALKGKTSSELRAISELYQQRYGINLEHQFRAELPAAEGDRACQLLAGEFGKAAAAEAYSSMTAFWSNIFGNSSAGVEKILTDLPASERSKFERHFNENYATKVQVVAGTEDSPPVYAESFRDAVTQLYQSDSSKLVLAQLEGDEIGAKVASLHRMTSAWFEPESEIGHLLEELATRTREGDSAAIAQFAERYEREYGGTISESLRKEHGDALLADLHDNLGGPSLDWCLASLNGDKVSADAHKLRYAMGGFVDRKDAGLVNGSLATVQSYGGYLLGGFMDGTDEKCIAEVFDIPEKLRDLPLNDPQRLEAISAQVEHNQGVIGRYQTYYPGRNLDAELASELSPVLKKLTDLRIANGTLTIAERIAETFEEDSFDGTDVETLRKLTANLSKTEVSGIRDEIRELTGQNLEDLVSSELSGDEYFDIHQALKGQPESVDEEVERRRERLQHERSGLLSFTVWTPAREMDEDFNALERFAKKRQNLEPREKERLEALLAQFDSSADGFRAAKNSMADTVAMGSAIAVSITISVATLGSATPVTLTLLLSTAAGSAAASFATSSAAKYLIKGNAYGLGDLGADAGFALLDGVTSAVGVKLSAPFCKAAAKFITAMKLGANVSKEVFDAEVENLLKGGVKSLVMELTKSVSSNVVGDTLSGNIQGFLLADRSKPLGDLLLEMSSNGFNRVATGLPFTIGTTTLLYHVHAKKLQAPKREPDGNETKLKQEPETPTLPTEVEPKSATGEGEVSQTQLNPVEADALQPGAEKKSSPIAAEGATTNSESASKTTGESLQNQTENDFALLVQEYRQRNGLKPEDPIDPEVAADIFDYVVRRQEGDPKILKALAKKRELEAQEAPSLEGGRDTSTPRRDGDDTRKPAPSADEQQSPPNSKTEAGNTGEKRGAPEDSDSSGTKSEEKKATKASSPEAEEKKQPSRLEEAYANLGIQSDSEVAKNRKSIDAVIKKRIASETDTSKHAAIRADGQLLMARVPGFWETGSWGTGYLKSAISWVGSIQPWYMTTERALARLGLLELYRSSPDALTYDILKERFTELTRDLQPAKRRLFTRWPNAAARLEHAFNKAVSTVPVLNSNVPVVAQSLDTLGLPRQGEYNQFQLRKARDIALKAAGTNIEKASCVRAAYDELSLRIPSAQARPWYSLAQIFDWRAGGRQVGAFREGSEGNPGRGTTLLEERARAYQNEALLQARARQELNIKGDSALSAEAIDLIRDQRLRETSVVKDPLKQDEVRACAEILKRSLPDGNGEVRVLPVSKTVGKDIGEKRRVLGFEKDEKPLIVDVEKKKADRLRENDRDLENARKARESQAEEMASIQEGLKKRQVLQVEALRRKAELEADVEAQPRNQKMRIELKRKTEEIADREKRIRAEQNEVEKLEKGLLKNEEWTKQCVAARQEIIEAADLVIQSLPRMTRPEVFIEAQRDYRLMQGDAQKFLGLPNRGLTVAEIESARQRVTQRFETDKLKMLSVKEDGGDDWLRDASQASKNTAKKKDSTTTETGAQIYARAKIDACADLLLLANGHTLARFPRLGEQGSSASNYKVLGRAYANYYRSLDQLGLPAGTRLKESTIDSAVRSKCQNDPAQRNKYLSMGDYLKDTLPRHSAPEKTVPLSQRLRGLVGLYDSEVNWRSLAGIEKRTAAYDSRDQALEVFGFSGNRRNLGMVAAGVEDPQYSFADLTKRRERLLREAKSTVDRAKIEASYDYLLEVMPSMQAGKLSRLRNAAIGENADPNDIKQMMWSERSRNWTRVRDVIVDTNYLLLNAPKSVIKLPFTLTRSVANSFLPTYALDALSRMSAVALRKVPRVARLFDAIEDASATVSDYTTFRRPKGNWTPDPTLTSLQKRIEAHEKMLKDAAVAEQKLLSRSSGSAKPKEITSLRQLNRLTEEVGKKGASAAELRELNILHLQVAKKLLRERTGITFSDVSARSMSTGTGILLSDIPKVYMALQLYGLYVGMKQFYEMTDRDRKSNSRVSGEIRFEEDSSSMYGGVVEQSSFESMFLDPPAIEKKAPIPKKAYVEDTQSTSSLAELNLVRPDFQSQRKVRLPQSRGDQGFSTLKLH